MNYSTLMQRSLDLAAGTRVDPVAYESWGINLAKLQSVGKCYRQGWLHNVLRRITPLNLRQMDDYVMMADLFVANRAEAQMMLSRMSQDLSAFATTAGILPTEGAGPLQSHLGLYQQLAARLGEKFGFEAPAPFASTTIGSEVQAQMPFVREFMRQRFAA